MTQEDILEMARIAGLTDAATELQHEIDAVMRFAELVAAAERTTVLNELADMVSSCDSRATPRGIAAAIRVRCIHGRREQSDHHHQRQQHSYYATQLLVFHGF